MSNRSAALRIGLLSASTIFLSAGLVFWATGLALTHPLSLALSMIVWLCGILTAGVALLPSVPRRATWFVLVSYIAIAFQVVYIAGLTYGPSTAAHSDNEMIGKYALEALKRGENPYDWNFSDFTRVYRDSLDVTPFLDGSTQNRFTYPALPVLMLWAFDRIGLGEVRTVNFIFFVLLLILIFAGSPEGLRPLILLPLLVLIRFTSVALDGSQDVVWCALLVGMILAWKRPVLRAVLFGLAAAFHQQPWLVAPFLLIVLWHEGGTVGQRARRIAMFAGISVGLFVLINLPFMLMNFQTWALGTFEPAYATFNMYSEGFASLSGYGIARLPREFYTALQFAFFAVALIVQFRHPRRIGPMFWVFPAIFFWLYYRALTNYWIFWIPLLLIALARREHTHSDSSPHGWRLTALVSLLIIALPIALGVYYASSRPLITASFVAPVVTSDGGASSGQLTITVTNDDDHVFRPRFAVQHDTSGQAQPWSILSGPDNLAPGGSAQYVIGNNDNYLTDFPVNEGAQVVVSDADGSYQRRALVSIPADTSGISSDLIHNPAFGYWNEDASLPVAWTLHTSGSGEATTTFQQVEGHSALTLVMKAPGLARISQQITFPGTFLIWVHPPTSVDVYGLEADDGYHRLWILFGSTEPQTVIGPANHATIYQPAPLNVWSQQTVNLEQLYKQLGWKLPSFALNADHPVRQITLSFIASNRQPLELTSIFGPINQDREAMSLDHLVGDALTYPDQYYVYVGNQYRLQRDDEQAVQAYTTALAYNPESADAYLAMAQSKWRLGKFDDGLAAFKRGLSLWIGSLSH